MSRRYGFNAQFIIGGIGMIVCGRYQRDGIESSLCMLSSMQLPAGKTVVHINCKEVTESHS